MKIIPIINEQQQGKDGTYPIVIRVAHKGARKLYYTGFRTKKEWWQNGKVTKDHPDSKLVNSTITCLLGEALQKVAQSQVTGKAVKMSKLFKQTEVHYFGAYIESLRAYYLKKGSYTMYRKCGRFKIEIEECFGGDVLFDELDQQALRKLEEYMIDRGNTPNTRHKKFKFYSSFFNRAIREELTENKNPFMDYEIKTERGYKERLSPEEIKILEDMQLEGRYKDVRNMALFSYYCKGMRFENCVTAKWSQVRNDRIYFHLVKSHKPLSVKIHPKLEAILEQYKYNNPYIFPFMTRELSGVEKVKQIDSLNTIANRHIKDIIKQAGITKKISFHNFRHSVAFNMKKKGLSTDEIKDHLGHSRVTVTEQYLQSLDDEHLDNTLENFYLWIKKKQHTYFKELIAIVMTVDI